MQKGTWLILLGLLAGCTNSAARELADADTGEPPSGDTEGGTPEGGDAGELVRLPDGGTSAPIECEQDDDCPEGVFCTDSYCELPPVGAADPPDAAVELMCEEGDDNCAALMQHIAASSEDAGPPVSELACTDNSDCVLVPTECCGACPATFASVRATTVSGAQEHETECADTECTACEARPELLLDAVCSEGECSVVNLARAGGTEARQCDSHDDCSVRAASCCECGAATGPGRLVAVSNPVAFEAAVCGAEDICDRSCTVSYPSEVSALCSAGRCVATDPRP